MHYLKYIRYEEGGYGFNNEWVVARFSTAKLKDAFMKIWVSAVPLTTAQYKTEKAIPVYDLDWVTTKKEGKTMQFWQERKYKP